MGIVQVLDETLANQIAAGEVVERPASVAKELLENALDAGATAIEIEIVGGGIERLRITDNGRGMSPEDAVVCLERHATSKLRTSEDLAHITTLGFRGEALPSIASVSRFRLRTREAGAVGATVVAVEGGRRRPPSEAGGPPGTEVLVEDLFFNVPARRKFLKKPETEAAHIQESVVQLSLAWPGIAFRVVKDGRTALDLPKHERLADRVRALFGREVGGGLAPVDVRGGFSVDGLVGLPPLAFGSARHLHCFVNGRYIRDRVVIGAVQAAYSGALERGRYPFVVLHLRIPPEAVDVNVHPAKTEVRFVDSGAIHRFLHRSILEAMRRADGDRVEDPPAPLLGLDPAPDPEPRGGQTPTPTPARRYELTPAATDPPVTVPAPAIEPEGGGLDAHRRRIFDAMERIGAQRSLLPAGSALRSPPSPTTARRAPEPVSPAAPELPVAEALPSPSEATRASSASGLAEWRAVGFLGPRLALCLAPDALVAVDYPAARRALLLHRLRGGATPTRLASPLVVRLTPLEARRAGSMADTLSGLGLLLEPFGGESFVLTTVPAGLEGAASPEALVRAALADGPEPVAGRLARLAAERAPETPSVAEFTALLRALAPFEPGFPPWAVPIPRAELERRLPRSTPGGVIP